MKPEYQEWVDKNVKEPYGKCSEMTTKMIEAFPELKRIRGQYDDPIWGLREHWWLEDPDENVVDPTKEQFPSKGAFSVNYIPWDESQPEPTGKCPNCGEYCYEGRYLCSTKCEQDYAAYVMRSAGRFSRY